MSLSVSLKSVVAAAIVATPLMLVACGSNDNEASDAGTSTVTSSRQSEGSESSSTEATTEESSSENESESAAADPAHPEGEPGADPANPAAGEAGAAGGAPSLVDPFAGGNYEVAQVDPVQGEPANEADAQAVRGLVNGLYSQETMHGFLSYMPANTCAAVLEENGGADAFRLEGVPDMPMNQFPGWENVGVADISDITVNGDQASAYVTVNTAEGPDSATQRFAREGGQWKFCN